jgi:hypothetical protein
MSNYKFTEEYDTEITHKISVNYLETLRSLGEDPEREGW